MNRRDFLIATTAVGIWFALPGCADIKVAFGNKQEARPNTVLFLVDDMGWQDTSEAFYKETTALNKRYRTPDIEALANEGVKFTQAYA